MKRVHVHYTLSKLNLQKSMSSSGAVGQIIFYSIAFSFTSNNVSCSSHNVSTRGVVSEMTVVGFRVYLYSYIHDPPRTQVLISVDPVIDNNLTTTRLKNVVDKQHIQRNSFDIPISISLFLTDLTKKGCHASIGLTCRFRVTRGSREV